MKRKALVSLSFATMLLHHGSLCAAADDVDSDPQGLNAIVKKICDETNLFPEVRAQYLLNFAKESLSGSRYEIPGDGYNLSDPTYRLDRSNLGWSADLSRDIDHLSSHLRRHGNDAAERCSEPELSILKSAVREALKQIEQTKKYALRYKQILEASLLFQQMQDISGQADCNQLLESEFRSCELNPSATSEEVIAAAEAMNSMAYLLIPIRIPRVDPRRILHQRPTTESYVKSNFRESESLRLRAVALLDRLPATSSARRIAHLDLAIWYVMLSKHTRGEEERDILFKLIGKSRPVQAPKNRRGCAFDIAKSENWWLPESGFVLGCGMG